MARLDGLLRSMSSEGASALLLSPGKPPCLRLEGEDRPMGGALDGPTIALLLEEIGDKPPELGGGERWEFEYRHPSTVVTVIAVEGDGGWSAQLRPAAAPEKPTAESIAEVGGAYVVEPIDDEEATSPSAIAAAAAAATEADDDEGGLSFALDPPKPESEPAPERAVEPPAQPARARAEPDSIEPLPGIDELLILMSEVEASDLHIAARQQLRQRVDGELEVLTQFGIPSNEQIKALVEPILDRRSQQRLAETNDCDLAYELEGYGRFRVHVSEDRLGRVAVFRRIPPKTPTFDDLGLPEDLRRLAQLNAGLVLVTGPTGSGKSTTLAAIVDVVNRTRAEHIITIEDPIEYIHPSRRSLVNQRQVGLHTETFNSALRGALRSDPDVILVGEMRDLETASIAIATAETGHLVYGTLHTRTAPSTIERLVDQFPSNQQEQIRVMLAESLRAVVSQVLLKRIGGGRVAAFEVLMCTPAVSNLIREGKTFQILSAMQTGHRSGMMLLNDSLFDLVKRGIVDPGEAWKRSLNRESFEERLRREGIKLRDEEKLASDED